MTHEEVWASALEVKGVPTELAKLWAPAFAEHCKPQNFRTGINGMDKFMERIIDMTHGLTRVDRMYDAPQWVKAHAAKILL